jgi:hypothetical protein
MTALIFVLMTLAHELFFQGLGGYAYFLTAALIDASIIFIISRLKYRTKLTENLIKIGFCFILVNTIGWLMWENSINYELAYEAISSFLYLCVIVSMLNWDGIEDGNYIPDDWIATFYADNMGGHSGYKKL